MSDAPQREGDAAAASGAFGTQKLGDVEFAVPRRRPGHRQSSQNNTQVWPCVPGNSLLGLLPTAMVRTTTLVGVSITETEPEAELGTYATGCALNRRSEQRSEADAPANREHSPRMCGYHVHRASASRALQRPHLPAGAYKTRSFTVPGSLTK